MKILLCPTVWLGVTTLSHAQVLPIPNARNPDWVLGKTTLGFLPSWPDTLAGGCDRMPIDNPSGQDKVATMPNALTRSFTSIGSRHQYWDADRRLSYEWQARAGQVAPDSLVTVKQQATGATFTYRRATKQLKSHTDFFMVIPSK